MRFGSPGALGEVEDYYNGPVYTPAGRLILLTIKDACPRPRWWTTTRQALTAALATTTINFPALCWEYAITRSGERRKGAPAGAAQTQEPRRKHHAKTTDSGAFVLLSAVYAAPGYGFCRGGAGQRPATSRERLCEHHPSHDAACGYTEGTEGSPCTHEHTEDCYILVTSCVHEHGPECYPAQRVSENTATPFQPEEAEPTACAHVCSGESGCITEVLDCRHTHDAACGYVPATEGTPCAFVCEVCNAQDSGDTAAPSDAQPEECTCETLCTEDNINGDCPVCGAEEADLAVCEGTAPAMLSIAAPMAGGDTVYVGGVALTGSADSPVYATTDTSGNGTTGDATADNYNIKWDGSTLTLKDATIKGDEGIKLESEAEIVLIGENEVTGESGSGISFTTHITISGEGELAVTGSSNGIYSGYGSIIIEGGNITAVGNDGYGIIVYGHNEHITISGGEVNATGNGSFGYGIYTDDGNINISGGTVTAIATGERANGIRAGKRGYNLNISGGNVTAIGEKGYGVYSGESGGAIYISGGTVTAWGERAGISTIEIGEGNLSGILEITGGIVMAGGDETAIRTNGEYKKENCIIFENGVGTVYGEVTLEEDLTIGEGESLNIPSGASLNTGSYNLIVNGGKLTGENIPTEGVVYKVTEVTLSPSTLTLDVNKSETLTVTITPDNATDQNVTWSSAPNGIVIIASSTDTKTATITATGTGGTSATITATDTGDKTYYAKWLSADAGVASVSVNGVAGNISGNQITVTLPPNSALPDGTDDITITPAAGASSSDLTFSADTENATYTFTVTAEDGQTTANYTVTVTVAADPAAGNKADVDAAKTAVESHTWTVPQATANTEEAVKAWIEGQLAGLAEIGQNSVSYTVTMTDFTAAAEGTAADRDGTNGSFAFTVTLSKGTDTGNIATSTYAEATAIIANGEITATAYDSWTVTVTAGTGGTVSGGGTFKEGSDVTVTANANSGYRFVRWEENGAQVSTDREYTFTLTADRTLNAVFTRVITYYTLTFETNGGSPIDAVQRAFGTTVNLSGYLPVREGYEFGGWYADAQLTEKVTEIRLNRNRTVYAGWTEKAPEEPEEPQKNPDGSVQAPDGTYLVPGTPILESAQVYASGNQVRAVLSGESAGAQGYDYVISENINCINDKDYLLVSKNIEDIETYFRYVPQGTYYVYCHAWLKDENGQKVFSSWSNGQEVEVTAVTPETPRIQSVRVNQKAKTITLTYTRCENAAGYDIILGSRVEKVNGENRPVDYGKRVKKITNGNTVTVTLRNAKKRTYYMALHAWNRTSEDRTKVFSPWSNIRRIVIK